MTIKELWKIWRLRISEEDRLCIASAIDRIPTPVWTVRAQKVADIFRGITNE